MIGYCGKFTFVPFSWKTCTHFIVFPVYFFANRRRFLEVQRITPIRKRTFRDIKRDAFINEYTSTNIQNK